MKKERMYEVDGKRVPTWNPFVGCSHNCGYCYARDIAKRQKHHCLKCYDFVPHMHPERLKKMFKAGETVFVCSMGDISFASFEEFNQILEVTGYCPDTTFYIQSKDPSYFNAYIKHYSSDIRSNILLGTTIETNLDITKYGNAPIPKDRVAAIKELTYRKYVTIEPIINFSMDVMVRWIAEIKPEFVYIGYNSRDRDTRHLPEPSLSKTEELITKLEKITEVRRKSIRKGWWEK